MESFFTVTALAACLAWLAVSILIILNLNRLVRSYTNSERILQRMLELMKNHRTRRRQKDTPGIRGEQPARDALSISILQRLPEALLSDRLGKIMRNAHLFCPGHIPGVT